MGIPILVAQLQVEGGGILTGSEHGAWSSRALMQSNMPLRLPGPGLVVVHRQRRNAQKADPRRPNRHNLQKDTIMHFTHFTHISHFAFFYAMRILLCILRNY